MRLSMPEPGVHISATVQNGSFVLLRACVLDLMRLWSVTCFSVCHVMTVFMDFTQISPCKTSALSLLPVIFSLKPGSQFDGWTEGWAAGQRQLRQTAIQGCCWNYSSTFAFTLFRLLHFTLKNYFVESYLSKLKNDKKSSFCFVSLNYFIGLKVFHWTLHTKLGIVGIKEV